jgi:hypothetical protein
MNVRSAATIEPIVEGKDRRPCGISSRRAALGRRPQVARRSSTTNSKRRKMTRSRLMGAHHMSYDTSCRAAT